MLSSAGPVFNFYAQINIFPFLLPHFHKRTNVLPAGKYSTQGPFPVLNNAPANGEGPKVISSSARYAMCVRADKEICLQLQKFDTKLMANLGNSKCIRSPLKNHPAYIEKDSPWSFANLLMIYAFRISWVSLPFLIARTFNNK